MSKVTRGLSPSCAPFYLLACLLLLVGGLPRAGASPAAAGAADSARRDCGRSADASLPARADSAASGSEFVARTRALAGPDRDALVVQELLSGNLPGFLRRLAPVTFIASKGGELLSVTLCVLPDYLAIGSDRDFVYVPMGLEAALRVAARFGSALPTARLVDAIYAQSAVKLDPQPLAAGDQMRSTDYFARHSELIAQQREAIGVTAGDLTAGHKKDLVLTSRLWDIPGRVAIYGWHRAVDQPIQPLSTVHGARYADYSHGIRLVSDTVYVDGARRSLTDLLSEPMRSRLQRLGGPLADLLGELATLSSRPGLPLVPSS